VHFGTAAHLVAALARDGEVLAGRPLRVGVAKQQQQQPPQAGAPRSSAGGAGATRLGIPPRCPGSSSSNSSGTAAPAVEFDRSLFGSARPATAGARR
jgi:hypothetical protein